MLSQRDNPTTNPTVSLARQTENGVLKCVAGDQISPMFGYSGSGHPGYSDMSVQSPGAHGQLPSIPSLFSHLHSHGSPGPGPATPDTDPYYHQAQGPSVTGFPGYQTQLKRPKKKPRSPKMGPDGIPCKRKSREGTTTYLWEFLLKLLQV